MRALVRRFREEVRGATATEYAMLLVFIVMVLAVGASFFGTSLSSIFSQTGASISAATPSLPQPF